MFYNQCNVEHRLKLPSVQKAEDVLVHVNIIQGLQEGNKYQIGLLMESNQRMRFKNIHHNANTKTK